MNKKYKDVLTSLKSVLVVPSCKDWWFFTEFPFKSASDLAQSQRVLYVSRRNNKRWNAVIHNDKVMLNKHLKNSFITKAFSSLLGQP